MHAGDQYTSLTVTVPVEEVYLINSLASVGRLPLSVSLIVMRVVQAVLRHDSVS